jgi:hypothetical protein
MALITNPSYHTSYRAFDSSYATGEPALSTRLTLDEGRMVRRALTELVGRKNVSDSDRDAAWAILLRLSRDVQRASAASSA